ncbi:acetyl-CoA synthetase-like protein [Armillaria gallica]|uniref:Acetyl-CoA synthetase-like protein n=1 Tax=Armillaria gallica TaxID=47427 RepID=A0A2H3E8U5_ARMGA|nr:acetyl-CoA synthetase-like protein [Armillaria gallica]
MLVQSPFPEPPSLTDANAYNVLLNRPDQREWKDYTLHIDAVTGRKRSFYEFRERVQDAAAALGGPVTEGCLGLSAEEDEMVGIISENSSDYVVLVQSLLYLATPFALISSYSTPFELAHALKLAKVTTVFVQARLFPLVLSQAKEAGLSRKKIFILGGRIRGRKSFSDMISHVKVNIPVYENKVFVMGKAEVRVSPPIDTPEGIPITLAFLPMHHSYGLHAYCFRSFIVPHTYIIFPKWNLAAAMKAIPKYHITNLTLVPSVVHQIANHPKLNKRDLKSVKHVGCGAAYLPKELADKLLTTLPPDVELTEGYGMSEATIAALTLPTSGSLGGRLKRIKGCSGVLLPGVEARLLRDDGTEADFDEVGELYIKSHNVSPGYWNNEKATREAFDNGWLRTGDKFTIDRDGYFFFADRAKDTLKVSGSQVAPVEIENVLLAHPEGLISDATVAGVSGGRTSDEKVPRAWVVLSPAGKKKGTAEVIKALESWHQESLSKYKWLRGGIEIVREIPKSPTGKTLRRILVDKYEKRIHKRMKSKL